MAGRKMAYDVHPSVADVQQWIRDLPAKSGRSLDAWMTLVRAQKLATEAAARDWLKREHAMGTNTAWWIVERAFAKDLSLMDDDPERYLALLAPTYVEAQYTGKKAALRPIYDALLALSRGLGKDIKVCPCKTMVPVYREHVIAQIKATTNSRVDFGLALGALVKAKKKLPARLVDTGGFAKKDRITHRIELTGPGGVDEFVARWAGEAYALDA